ncbi:MAG: hypothetical protein CVU58_00035 [Deltaproteobacteria bacterium HGW-Deltaproteobacteria-16]|nr:MAG: hypothetical protein CVU58_00035 [Deltaproteobacteria bacterium HGW-Deltaproteobacteria-16]
MGYNLIGRTLYPLSDLLSQSEFPLLAYIPPDALQSLFDGLYYTDAEAYTLPEGVYLNLRLAFETELALTPPGLPGLKLVAGAGGNGWTTLQVQFLIGPDAMAEISDIPLCLRVDKSILQPMLNSGQVDESKPGVEIPLGTVTLKISKDGFVPDLDITASIPQSMLLNTGFLIQANTIRVIFNPPLNSALPEGLDPSFRGVYINEAAIFMPQGWEEDSSLGSNAKIVGKKLIIGTDGGFSGQFLLDVSQSSLLRTTLPGGIRIGLDTFSLIFDKKNITQSDIRGKLSIPGLKDSSGQNDAELLLAVSLTNASYYFSATVQNDLKIGDILVNLSQCALTFQQSKLQDIRIAGNLTLPVLSDDSGQPAVIDFVFSMDQGYYKLSTQTTIPPLMLGAFGLGLNSFSMSFDHAGVHALAADGQLIIPGLQNEQSQSAAINILFSYANSSYRVEAAGTFPPLKLGNFSLNFSKFSIVFNHNGITLTDIQGWLEIPGTDDGTGALTRINFSLGENAGTWTFSLGSPQRFKIGGIEAGIATLSGTIDSLGLQAFAIGGWLEIPGTEPRAGEADAHITFALAESANTWAFSLGAEKPLAIGGMEVGITNLSGSINAQGLQAFAIDGWLEIPGAEPATGDSDAHINFALAESAGTWTFALGAEKPLTIGGMEVGITNLSGTINAQGLQAFAIDGWLQVPAFEITLDIAITITAHGFQITAQIPAGVDGLTVLDIEDIIQVQLRKLGIGKENATWAFSFGLKVTNRMDIPVVGKFLPQSITFNDFTYSTPDNNIDLDMSMTWQDGLIIGGNTRDGINALIPVNKDIESVFFLRALQLSTKNLNPGLGVSVELMGAKFAIGPFTAVVDGMGLSADFRPQDHGNLGPLNVGLGIIPPKGLGVSLKTDMLTAGGYLYLDFENERYAGAIEISVKKQICLNRDRLADHQAARWVERCFPFAHHQHGVSGADHLEHGIFSCWCRRADRNSPNHRSGCPPGRRAARSG